MSLPGDDRKTHRTDQAHLAHLFAGVNFDFVTARCPLFFRREQFQIPALIFQGHVHGVFADDRVRFDARDPFGKASAEYFEGLIVLMECEDDEDGRRIGDKSLGRFDRDNFVGLAKAQFLFKPLGHGDGAEHSLRGRVEVVRFGIFRTILKLRYREILCDRQFPGPDGGWPSEQGSKDNEKEPAHMQGLVHPLRSESQGEPAQSAGAISS